ncbi:MAG: hypothetical protein ABI193_12535 [Minicystis sp.]
MRRGLVILLGAALSALGCDAGGLLQVDATQVIESATPIAVGPSSLDFVSGGTVAANTKYKLVYVVGQPTPNQAPQGSPDNRLNGGLVGAMNGSK